MKCLRCGEKPDEICEYTESAKERNITPEEYVRVEEGTYNPRTDVFWCTSCYVKLGMPLGKAK